MPDHEPPQPVDLPQELAGENRTDPARDVNMQPELERLEISEVTQKS